MIENFRVRVFRAVAEERSFRKASEALHLSQPAVSQQVHALEEELGVRLLDRSKNQIELTEAGRVLLRYSRRSAKIAQEVMAELAILRGEAGGELRLGASTTISQYLLPRIVGAFLQENPTVHLQLKSGNTEEVVEGLIAGTLDLGLIEGPSLSKQVQTELFLHDSMVLIAPNNHRWPLTAFAKLEDLKQVPFLFRERGSGSRHVVESALKQTGLRMKDLHIALELDSTEAIVSGVEAGLGVGFVSSWAVGKELRLGTVVPISVDGLNVRREFTLVRIAGPLPAGAAGAFRHFAFAQREEIEAQLSEAKLATIRKTNQA